MRVRIELVAIACLWPSFSTTVSLVGNLKLSGCAVFVLWVPFSDPVPVHV